MKFHVSLYEEKYFAHTCPWEPLKGLPSSNFTSTPLGTPKIAVEPKMEQGFHSADSHIFEK